MESEFRVTDQEGRLRMNISTVLLAILIGAVVSSAPAKEPDCSGGWPTAMAFVHLKNAGITDNDEIDFSKTKTVRLASERIGKDLYHQVYDVKYTEKSGRIIEAIVVHD